MLSVRIEYAGAALFRYVETHCAGLQLRLASTAQGSDELAPLRRVVAQNALTGEYRAAAAANMSLRSAQRLTANLSLSLQRSIDRAREDQAKGLLIDSQIDLNAKSLLVGCSIDRAFPRAFQRWTGQSPSEYRDELKAER